MEQLGQARGGSQSACPSGTSGPDFPFGEGAATTLMTAVEPSGDTSGLISARYSQERHLHCKLKLMAFELSAGYTSHQIRGFRAFLSCSNAQELMSQLEILSQRLAPATLWKQGLQGCAYCGCKVRQHVCYCSCKTSCSEQVEPPPVNRGRFC